MTVPLGLLATLPTVRNEEYEALVARSRERYCAPVSEMPLPPEAQAPPLQEPEVRATRAPEPPPSEPVPPSPTPRVAPVAARAPASEPHPTSTRTAPPVPKEKSARKEPPALGRGGKQHTYLQELIKQAAEAKGFRAVIEEPILDGAGRVDVSLTLGATRVACEISVTSTKEQELGNIEKCLTAGYDTVIVVSKIERQLATLRKCILPQLEPKAVERVRFCLPEELVGYLDVLAAMGEVSEETVRGYKVKVTRQPVSDAEAQARKAAIASVIAKSLGSLSDKA
jgi:hypothetical protein